MRSYAGVSSYWFTICRITHCLVDKFKSALQIELDSSRIQTDRGKPMYPSTMKLAWIVLQSSGGELPNVGRTIVIVLRHAHDLMYDRYRRQWDAESRLSEMAEKYQPEISSSSFRTSSGTTPLECDSEANQV